MKKQLIFLCALAVVATACNVKESGQSTGLRLVTFTASSDSPADTKTSYTDEGVFSWTENDEIAVYTDAGQFYPLTLTEGAGTGTGTFTGTISGTLSDYAVYPYLGTDPTYDGTTTLSVYLPESYNWIEGVAYNPMVGKISDTIAFKNLAGLFKITLEGVPATATKVTFNTKQRISGPFKVNNLGSDTPTIYTEDTENDTYTSVSFTFKTLNGSTDMVFYLPVPVGEYDNLGFNVLNENSDTLWRYTSTVLSREPINVERNKLWILESLYSGTVGAEGDPNDNF